MMGIMPWPSTAATVAATGVGHGEEGPALGVPDQHVADPEPGQHARADLARPGPGVLVGAVLGPQGDRDAFLLHQGLHGAQVGEGRVHRDVQGRHVVGLEPQAEVAHHVQGLDVVVVHLPVPAEERAPGRGRH
jgi:hypothetical protein